MLATPAGRLERLALGTLLAALAFLLVYTQALWRWDQLIYDTQLGWWSRPAPPDVVIVAIDEESLNALGRWPWPRHLHAELVDRLTDAGAKAVGLDILFAEPDRNPGADRLLGQSIARNRRTALPVFAEPPRIGAQLVERLPISTLAASSAKMGHIHVELDPDGIARSVFLKAGLGEPHWPTLSLAMLMIGGEAPPELPGLRNPDSEDPPSRAWVRDHHVFVPFVGAQGAFSRLSYVKVLEGSFDPGLVEDSYVLVGMTAAGAGDALPTPVSGQDQFMPGVEFNANVLDALRRGITITPIALRWQYLITALIAVLPVFVYTRVPPRLSSVAAISLIASTVLVSMVLLHYGRLWFSPMAGLVALILSYPLWSWWRLASTMRFLDQELGALRAEQAGLNIAPPQPIVASVRFLARMMEPRGWLVRRRDTGEAEAQGIPVDALNPNPEKDTWHVTQDTLWTVREDAGSTYDVAFRFDEPRDKRLEYAPLLNWFIRRSTPADNVDLAGAEIMETRIHQVRAATEDLSAVRQFIDDSISQMTTGVLVASRMGRVTLANPQAVKLLTGKAQSILGQSVAELLDTLEILDTTPPMDLIRSALLHDQRVSFNAKNQAGRYLYGQISAFAVENERASGLILNVSDVSELRESERQRAEVLGFVSHDIRSPLVSILALVELSESRETPDELRDLLKRTETYASKTLELAEQLLELSRAENLQPNDMTEFDLVSAATAAFDQTWSQAQAREIQIRFEPQVEAAWVDGDADLVERAIVNLITNAIKYSPSQTRVTLRLSASVHEFCCEVQDQGYGIADDEMGSVFERFQRGRSAHLGNERGIGLGLAFVHAVADRHGGRISVTSREGEGSTFSLVLPKKA